MLSRCNECKYYDKCGCGVNPKYWQAHSNVTGLNRAIVDSIAQYLEPCPDWEKSEIGQPTNSASLPLVAHHAPGNEDYLSLFHNHGFAWDQCQDLAWLFVMIDDSGYSETQQGQVCLRQFACWCARQCWNLLLHPSSQAAVETAERFTIGMANACQLETAWEAAQHERLYHSRNNDIVYQGAILAESCTYWRSEMAAFIAATFSARLVGSEDFLAAQPAKLRELMGANPYWPIKTSILTPCQTKQHIIQDWNRIEPQAKTPWGQAISRFKQWICQKDEKLQYQAYLHQFPRLSQAWDACLNPRWMLAMLERIHYSNADLGQSNLRQFACQCFEQRFPLHCSSDEPGYISVMVAKDFIAGRANRARLKQAEVEAFVACQDLHYDAADETALYCLRPSAMVAALGASETASYLNKEESQPLQVLKLRELIGNPFD